MVTNICSNNIQKLLMLSIYYPYFQIKSSKRVLANADESIKNQAFLT